MLHTKVWGIRVEEVGANVATSVFTDDDYEYDDPLAHREDDLDHALTSLAEVNIDDLQGINFETGQEEPDGNAGDPNHVHDHTHNYNVGELISGGADETNDIGRRNFFISAGHEDIDPETGKPRRDLSYYMMSLDILNEKARRMAELEAEIKALEEEKAKLQDRLDAIDTAEDLLDDEDLNDDTVRGREKREKLKAELRRLGYDVDEFTRPDGTIDVEAAQDALDEDRRTTQDRIDQIDRDIQDRVAEHSGLLEDVREAGRGNPAALAEVEALTDNDVGRNRVLLAVTDENSGLSIDQQVSLLQTMEAEDGKSVGASIARASLENADDKTSAFGAGMFAQTGLTAGPPSFMKGGSSEPPVFATNDSASETLDTVGIDEAETVMVDAGDTSGGAPRFDTEAPVVVLASAGRSEGSFAGQEFGGDDTIAGLKPITPAFAAVTTGEQPVVVASVGTDATADNTLEDRVYTVGGSGTGMSA